MKKLFLLMLSAQAVFGMETNGCKFVEQAEVGNIEYLRFRLRENADINEIDPRTEWTALHAALWNYDTQTAAFLLRHGASVYKKNKAGKTPRHFLTQHNAPCYYKNKLICKDTPCIVEWPKEFLEQMNGECVLCLNTIEEVGYIYDCGHVVHKKCVDDSNDCTVCFRPYREEVDSESNSLKKTKIEDSNSNDESESIDHLKLEKDKQAITPPSASQVPAQVPDPFVGRPGYVGPSFVHANRVYTWTKCAGNEYGYIITAIHDPGLEMGSLWGENRT